METVDLGEFEQSLSDLVSYLGDPDLCGKDALKALLLLDHDGAITDRLSAARIDIMDGPTRWVLFHGCISLSMTSSLEKAEGMELLDELGLLSFKKISLLEFLGLPPGDKVAADLGWSDRHVRAPFVSDNLLGSVQCGLTIIAKRRGLKVPVPAPDGPEQMLLELADGLMAPVMLGDLQGLDKRPHRWAKGPGLSSWDEMLALRGGLLAILKFKFQDRFERDLIDQGVVASIPLHMIFTVMGLYGVLWSGIVQGRPHMRVTVRTDRSFCFKPVPGGPLGTLVMAANNLPNEKVSPRK